MSSNRTDDSPAQHRRPSRRRLLTAAAGVLAGTGGLTAVHAASGAPAGTRTGSAVPGAGGARVVAEEWTDGRTVELRIASPAVGRTLPVRVLLPTDWQRHPDRTWPVLHLLQGAHDTYTSWTRETGIESFTRGKDLITVMPESGKTGIPTDWWHGGRGGEDYETFHADEVMAVLRHRFRAAGRRVVAGVSTGGYGALALAARRPGTFAAAASYSGLPHTRLTGVPSLLSAIVARELAAPSALWGNPVLQHANWAAHDPYTQARALRGIPLYVSAGTGLLGGGDGTDPPDGRMLESSVWPANKSFAARLERLGIPATVHLYRGGAHAWPYWQREFRASWPLLAGGLGLPAHTA